MDSKARCKTAVSARVDATRIQRSQGRPVVRDARQPSSAHTQANIDHTHPSAMLEWISKGLTNASNVDASTLVELTHACDAARTATHDTEVARADLQNLKGRSRKQMPT